MSCAVTAPHFNSLLVWGKSSSLQEERAHGFSICDLVRPLMVSSVGRKMTLCATEQQHIYKSLAGLVHLLHQEAVWFFSVPFIYAPLCGLALSYHPTVLSNEKRSHCTAHLRARRSVMNPRWTQIFLWAMGIAGPLVFCWELLTVSDVHGAGFQLLVPGHMLNSSSSIYKDN